MKNNFSFADFLKELEESKEKEVVKKVEQLQERKYFLIVCEGEKTEPNYFRYFRNKLPKHLLNTVELVGEGDNTLNVVKKAISLKLERLKDPITPEFDEVWAVFDKDDFPNERVDSAFNLANQSNIKCAFSNQSFELWYVLHFQYLDANLHRSQYIEILSDILGLKYEKNSEEIVELIFEKGDLNLAVKSSKKLEEINKGKSPSNSAPFTSVYLLVENLMEYCVPK
ncbi:RloB family protein [Psychroserpens sp. BH13MA-6]